MMTPKLVMLLAVLLSDLTVLLTVCFQNALILFWELRLSPEPGESGSPGERPSRSPGSSVMQRSNARQPPTSDAKAHDQLGIVVLSKEQHRLVGQLTIAGSFFKHPKHVFKCRPALWMAHGVCHAGHGAKEQNTSCNEKHDVASLGVRSRLVKLRATGVHGESTCTCMACVTPGYGVGARGLAHLAVYTTGSRG